MKSRLPKFLHPYQWVRNMIRQNHFTFEELQHARLTYSQFGEDLVVSSLNGFDKDYGFYIDVGAFHPMRLSNTYLFYRRGWRGINIEPNPKQFHLFQEMRKEDLNLNLAVSESSEILDFVCDYQYSRIISSIDKGRSAEAIKVNAEPLSRILDEHLPKNQRIDFLSIDCEGHDLKVIESNKWEKYRPKVILVEEHNPLSKSEIYRFLIH